MQANYDNPLFARLDILTLVNEMCPELIAPLTLPRRFNGQMAKRTLAGLLLVSCIAASSLGQEPFFAADPATDLAVSDGEETAETQAPRPPDAQEVELNQLAARGGVYLGDALNGFARVQRWDYADRWLNEGVGGIDDAAQLAEIASRIGTENLLRLSINDEIGSEAKAVLQKLNQAARSQAESKQRLLKAIDNLDASDTDARLQAARDLLAGGNAAIAALVDAVVSESPKAPREVILRTMLKLGDAGIKALHQLSIYGVESVRASATESLARINRREAMPAMLTGLYGSDSTPAEKQFAQVNLLPLTQTLPTADEARGFLFAELKRQRKRALEAENDYQTTALWMINDDLRSVGYQSTRAIIAEYRDAVDAGARLRRIGNLSPGMVDAVLAADISYRIMIDPDWGTAEQVKAVSDVYGQAVQSKELSRAIALALEKSDYPAAIGLLRMVARSPGGSNSQVLLVSGDSKMTALVRATLSPEPQVRYEATAAIVRLNPPASFTGASHFMRCLAEMRDLQNLPLVLLVETRTEVAMQQEIILGRMGYETEVVGKVLDLERCIARGGDLKMILSKTQLWDIPPVEMIDRVRRIPRGKNVPIVFYGDPAIGIDSDRWDGLSRLIEQPGTPAAFTNLLMDLDLTNRLPEMTALDRLEFRKTAREYLQSRR